MRVYKRYEHCTLDNYECKDSTQKELVAELKKGIEKGFDTNICIIGGVGTGKTHLAYAVVKELSEVKEYSFGKVYSSSQAEYTTIKEIVDNIRKCWSKESDKYDLDKIDSYKKISLLIIDELGVQYGSESERIELFEIFNARYNEMLPTIIISNCNRDQISKILGQRITDRLFSGAKTFELQGRSYRSELSTKI